MSHEGKCDTIRNKLLQPPPPLDRVFSPDVSTRLQDNFPFHQIMEEEIRESIYKKGNNLALGHSQITYMVIKWTWNSKLGHLYITNLLWKCL
jgi:hypothetical protein